VTLIERKMKSYPGGIATVWNRRAKPGGQCSWERCQGGAAMCRREEAGSLDLAGWPLSRYDGRVSPLQTKPNLSLGTDFSTTTNAIRRRDGTVRHAVMRGKWLIGLNDEILRRPGSPQVTLCYKAVPNSRSNALVTETASLWLRLQGCQQSQSKAGLVSLAPKALPQIDSVSSAGPRNKLAPGLRTVSYSPAKPQLRTATHRERKHSSVQVGLPILWGKVCPLQEHRAPARCRRRPVRERRSPVNMENRLHRDNGEGVAARPLPYPLRIVTQVQGNWARSKLVR